MSAPQKKRRAGFALGSLAVALGLTVSVVGLSSFRAAGANAQPSYTQNILPVRASEIRREASTVIKSEYPGLVSARRTSALAFEIGGRIDEINVDVGDVVNAGDRLAKLDTNTLEANLAAARAQTRALIAQADLAEVTLNRQRTLVEQGHISAQALDQAEANFGVAQASAASAEASANALSVQIENATIKAPYTGVITGRSFDEGAVAGAGAPVLQLVEDGVLEIQIGLPASVSAELHTGQSYPIVTAYGETDATLRTVTGVIHPGARTVEAVFDLPEGFDVPSGTVARLSLESELQQSGFWAPLTSLAEGQRGLWSIYVLSRVNGGYELEPRPVEILHEEGDQVFLNGAVEEGALFLSTGVHRVSPGMQVRPSEGP